MEKFNFYIGGNQYLEGTKMKSVNGWEFEGECGNGTNESGFSGLPGGGRESSGKFYGLGGYGCWYSAPGTDMNCLLSYNDGKVIYRKVPRGGAGYSVRCLKD
jgi:uncharacterized protein (TIGR02145 family)